MPRFGAAPLLAALLSAATACQKAPEHTDAASDSLTHVAPDSTAPITRGGTIPPAGDSAASAHGATRHEAAGAAGQALLPIMQKLGSDMTALTYALMTDDQETVARSAAAIADHAPISAQDVERIHGVLGSDMSGFEAVDESVHVAALRLHEAARVRRLDLVAERLGEMQRGCVSCHTRFRERLRTNRPR